MIAASGGTPPGARRLFLGLMPGPEVQHAIAAQCPRWYWPRGAQRTREGRFHLTLHFLGDGVGPEAQAVLCHRLPQLPVPAMDLVLDAPETWRNGVAVLRPHEHAGLRELYGRLKPLLAEAGLGFDPRPWTPHVTLARKAPEAGPPDTPVHIPWTAHECVLVWSRFDPARYEVLARSAPAGDGMLR